MTENFADCLVLNTVMAARALTRRYDKVLKPHDVSVIQFTVLMTVRDCPEMSVNGMAGRIAMDRTTLLRNLDLLERRGLVRGFKPEKGNIRHYALTTKGEALLGQLIPKWQVAQAEIRELVGDCDPDELLGALRALTHGRAPESRSA